MVKSADEFFTTGCGRCSLWNTPDCKVHKWSEELHRLRQLLTSTEMTEECKWGFPCYTSHNENVVLLSVFKEFVSLNFFKGVLFEDPDHLLVKAGENTYAARLFKFTSEGEINDQQEEIKNFIDQGIKIAQQGIKVEKDRQDLDIPEELQEKFDQDPVFKEAFELLTPGRQRGYIIYFSAPKQSKTRTSRIEQSIGKILNGEGMHDAYQKSKK